MTARGQFISIEGIEGAGKTTAQRFVVQYLKEKGMDVVATREPGGTDIAEGIRDLLLHRIHHEEVMLPETELLLMFASRAQHIRYHIGPLLEAGQWVVSDRYVDASYAYQGGGRGLNHQFIEMLDRHVVGGLYPQLTLLLDIAPTLGMARTERRGSGKDRIEQEKIVFFERVREAYRQRAVLDPKRIATIDASLSQDQVQLQIQKALDAFLAHH